MGLFDVLLLAYLHLMEIRKNVFITDLLQSQYKCPKRNKQYILTRVNSDHWPPTRWYRIFNRTTIALFTWFLPCTKIWISGFYMYEKFRLSRFIPFSRKDFTNSHLVVLFHHSYCGWMGLAPPNRNHQTAVHQKEHCAINIRIRLNWWQLNY